MKKPKRFAVINFKGGVGKTAMSVNLSASLAYYHGKRVLVVDLDPQSNASLWLMQPEHWREHTAGGLCSTYQIFQDHLKGTKRFDFEKAVISGAPIRDGASLLPNLDLLPAAVELLKVEDRIHTNKYVQFYKFVFRSLQPYFDEYDYVFFDCPPNVYSVTQNALFAADACLVPYVPDYLSLSGFKIFVEQVEAFYNRVSGAMTNRSRPGVAALAVSHYQLNINNFTRSIHELELQLQQLKDKKLVSAKTKILEPYVRRSASVSESTNAHVPACLNDANSIGTYDYYELSRAFLQHLESFK